MTEDSFDDFRSLSPEARIKKLKEIEEKRKKEIEEARKLIAESEEEIKEETQKKERIPIEQMTARSQGGLMTAEEKEMFRTKHFISGNTDIEKLDGEKRQVSEKEAAEHAMLEDVLRKETLPEDLDPALLNQYNQKVDNLKGELYAIEDRVEAGNMGYNDMKRAYVIEDELKGIAGVYHSTADNIEHTINVGERVIDKLRGTYKDEPRRPEQ